MKKFFILTICAVLTFSLMWSTVAAMDHFNQSDYVDLVVKLDSLNFDSTVLKSMGVVDMHRVFEQTDKPILQHYYRMKVDERQKNKVLNYLNSAGLLEWVDIDYQLSAAKNANDEFYTADYTDINNQWYLAKINASGGWDIETNAQDVTVAIIDTGIDGLHQDLKDGRVVAGYKFYCEDIVDDTCISRNVGEIDAYTNSDDNGHGTAVASVVGAISNNLAGIAGIAWQVKLMPIKVLNKNGIGTASDVAEGIVWAAENGADIINLSLGGATLADSSIIDVAADIATKEGAMVVAAAGNDRTIGVDLDSSPSNPVCADGQNNNVLGVAATDFNDIRAEFSNYGSKCIDIAAPGTRILTAHFDPSRPSSQNVYAYRSGTSFAAPIVSGVLALLKSFRPDWTKKELREHLVQNSDSIDDINTASCNGLSCAGKLGAGRVNLQKVLTAAGSASFPTNPGLPTNPVASNGSIVRAGGTNTLYYVENGIKRLLTPFVAEQRGLSTAQVIELSPADFNNLLLGEPLPPLDGTLIKSNSEPLVSVIKNGQKRPLTYFSFVRNGFSFAGVVSLDDFYVNSLPVGKVFPPPSGTLLREQTNPTVYLVENEELHAMTFTAFQNRGLNFGAVNFVPDGEINLYPIGTTHYQ